tara:strand:- start:34543 stop:35520 length:978 start_codon:yes stop_codon:yes gene_type:complete
MKLDYQTLFESVSVPFAVLDHKLCFVEANATYFSTLRRTREDLIGQYIWDAFPEDEERQEPLTAIFMKALQGSVGALREIPYAIAIPEEDGGGMREIWWTVHATPIEVGDGGAPLVGLRVQDVTSEVLMREMKNAIAGELQHRVGNLLSLVLTLARQTASTAVDVEDFLNKYQPRILSLAKTHAALTGGNWDGMTFRQLAGQQLEVYSEAHGAKIKLDGPNLRLSAKEAQAISMALHELATNAGKYGALKQADGQLAVTWKLGETDGFEFEWQESGLSDLQEPQSLGFGSMILTRILPSQLDGEAVREFTPTSMAYRLSVPKREA